MNDNENRIAVLGGSFNPVHNGHLAVAHAVMAAHAPARLLFVPNRRPPHKGHGALAPAHHRVEMIRLAIADEPAFEVSTIELEREGPSYTYDTATELRRALPEAEILFIIGSDCLFELHTWYRARELVDIVRLIVVTRERGLEDALQAAGGFLPEGTVKRMGADAVVMEPVEVSSTQIREALVAGENATGLVPDSVRDYMEEHRLYV